MFPFHAQVTAVAHGTEDESGRELRGAGVAVWLMCGCGQPSAVASDEALRVLLAPPLWQRYAADPRRAELTALLDRAKAQGRDPAELLAYAVNSGQLDAGAAFPARSVAAVLCYRVGAAMDAGHRRASAAGLPRETAELLIGSRAPYRREPDGTRRSDPAERTPWQRQEDRQQEGRDGR